METSRRNFIKNGLMGLAGVSFIPSKKRSFNHTCHSTLQEKKIIYRTLGKTGLKIPIVGIGVISNTDLVPTAYENGVKFIFTCGDYRNGNPERRIGEFLSTKPRDSYVVTTSVSLEKYIDHRTLKFRKNTSADILRGYLDRSLRRLKVDYIDIYFLGNLASEDTVMYEPFLEVLQEFKRKGKIKFIGAATHQNEHVVLKTAADSNVYDVVLTAYNFRKTNKQQIQDAVKYAADKGIGIVAMKTQAGVYWDSRRKNKINMKAALKWVLQDENVHTSIPGYMNTDEFNESFSVMENLTLSDSELKDLRITSNSPDTGLFCQQCSKCVNQCSFELNIPAIMRSYMYAYGYHDLTKSKAIMQSYNIKNAPCSDCGKCVVKCKMGFDIKRKTLDIMRINNIPDEFLV